MSGPVVKYSIDGSTNAEQVTGRVKESMGVLEKNIKGIENRFKSFGKDLFLSFAAPMVILNQAINMISGAIEKNRQKVQEALLDAEKGENKYTRAGTTVAARELASRRQDALDRQNAKLGAEAVAEEQRMEGVDAFSFGEGGKAAVQLVAEGKGKDLDEQARRLIKGSVMLLDLGGMMSGDTEMQDILERRAAARMAADPATATGSVTPGPAYSAPSGFSNVIGVGANPVMEAMTAQLEEQRKQTALLERIASPAGAPVDFTKQTK